MIGENYVQEAKRKIESVGRRCPWHMIGRLQTNKAKYAVHLFAMIHSLDRLELALELDRRSRAAGLVMPVLIEVNTSGEAAKSGVTPEEAPELARRVASLGGIALKGLMTMPPWFDEAEDARPYFASLRELRDRIAALGMEGVDMTELSMGMSQDYAVAVEEGATIVRVGRAIFGERSPKGAPG
jgi:PLP dependent protein